MPIDKSQKEGTEVLLMGNEAIARGALEAGVRVAGGDIILYRDEAGGCGQFRHPLIHLSVRRPEIARRFPSHPSDHCLCP